jgi:hypothetical protein
MKFVSRDDKASCGAVLGLRENRQGTRRSHKSEFVEKGEKGADPTPPPCMRVPRVLAGGLQHDEDNRTQPQLFRSKNHGQNTPLPLKFSPDAQVSSWLVLSRLPHQSTGKVR